MGKLEDSLSAVKKAISKAKVKNKRTYEDVISQVSSYLVFLKSTVLSQEAADKFSKCLRERLASIYVTFPQQGLQLAATLCQTIYESKILCEFTAGKHDQKQLWDKTLNALLSGVLDYFDENQSDKSKEAIGAALYATLCSIFFSISISHMSVELRCTGYSILSETADSHKVNQKRLSDASILGGTRLGSMLWRTRDFLVLENILNLFARMIPATAGTAAGRANRNAFIRSVFVDSSPDDAETGNKLAKMLETIPTADWEQTASKIIDVLAASNIAFPQPFQVAEVRVCEQVQPTDRLYVDEKGLVANVLVGADICDTLAVAYSTVTGVEISYRHADRDRDTMASEPLVMITLSSLPFLGKDPVALRAGNPANYAPRVTFSLERDDVPRFRQALKSRNINDLIKVNKDVKLSVLAPVTKLEMDSGGNLVEETELAQRIDNISQLYGTNDPSDGNHEEDDPGSHVLNVSSEASLSRKKTNRGMDGLQPVLSVDNQKTAELLNCLASDVNATVSVPALDTSAKSGISKLCPTTTRLGARPLSDKLAQATPPVTPLRRTKSQGIREAAFGTSDEELSDVDEPPEYPESPKKPQPVPTKYARRRILDSDDDARNSTPSRAHVPRKVGKRAVVISDGEDDIEEVLPLSNISSSALLRRRSTLVMTPVVEPKKVTVDDARRNLASNASGEAEQQGLPRSANKSKPARPSRKPVQASVSHMRLKDDIDSPNIGQASVLAQDTGVGLLEETEGDPKVILTPATKKDINVLPSAAEHPPQSVKAALRKKGGAPGEAKEPASHIKRPKRKRSLNPGLEDTLADDNAEGKNSKTRKRHKSSTESDAKEAGVKQGGVVHHETKRYGGRKGRTSSPATSTRDAVNYDLIPGSTPDTGADSAAPVKDPSPLPAKDVHADPYIRKTEEELIDKKTVRTSPRLSRERPGKHDVRQNTASENTKDSPTKAIKAAKRRENNEQKVMTTGPVTRSVEKQRTELEVRITSIDLPDLPGVDEVAPPSITENANLVDVWPIEPREPCSSTPKTKSSRKSNKKPWNLPSEGSNLDSGHVKQDATDPTFGEEQQRPISDMFNVAAVAVDTNVASVPPTERVEPDTPTLSEISILQQEVTLIEDMGVASPMRLNKPEEACNPKNIFIDLTEDSPRRPSVMSRRRGIDEPSDDGRMYQSEIMVKSEKTTPVSILKTRAIPAVSFAPAPSELSSTVPAVLNHKRMHKPRPREHSPILSKAVKDNSPSLEDIASVLNEIHEVILHKIHSKIDGVREDVRVGRNRLIADAASDLTSMRAESIDRYNVLIELEAEYAKIGRNLTYGYDDLRNANNKINTGLKKVILDHARAIIPKKAPGSLFTAPLPASIAILRGTE